MEMEIMLLPAEQQRSVCPFSFVEVLKVERVRFSLSRLRAHPHLSTLCSFHMFFFSGLRLIRDGLVLLLI